MDDAGPQLFIVIKVNPSQFDPTIPFQQENKVGCKNNSIFFYYYERRRFMI